MELNELKNELISYYEKHKSDYVQNITMEYIESNYPSKSLMKLYLSVLKSHPHSWGFPDVSAIETAADRFEISDKVSLKNKKETKEYSSSPKIEPLTDEELIEAEEQGYRDEWKKLVNKSSDKATDNLDPEKLEELKEDLKKENKKS